MHYDNSYDQFNLIDVVSFNLSTYPNNPPFQFIHFSPKLTKIVFHYYEPKLNASTFKFINVDYDNYKIY